MYIKALYMGSKTFVKIDFQSVENSLKSVRNEKFYSFIVFADYNPLRTL